MLDEAKFLTEATNQTKWLRNFKVSLTGGRRPEKSSKFCLKYQIIYKLRRMTMSGDPKSAVAALVAAKDVQSLEIAIGQAAFLDATPGDDRQKLRGTV
jgi:hypothetical protein